jgi:hypothetical protein
VNWKTYQNPLPVLNIGEDISLNLSIWNFGKEEPIDSMIVSLILRIQIYHGE